jgi:hypothetical protein
VVEPPQADGAVGVTGDLVNVPLHPPLAVVVSSHAANEALIVAWVWQAASVLSDAQLNTTAWEFSTVNVFVQVVVKGAQLLV